MANYSTKNLSVKKFGWKRIAKNTQRFGWVISDAVEHTEVTETTTYEATVYNDTIYVNPKTNRSSWVRVFLTFYRNSYLIPASVKVIEFFYNIIFFLRRVLAFFVPIATVLVILFASMGGANAIDGGETIYMIGTGWVLISGFWLAFIILENILARIASGILKRNGYFN